MNIYQRIVLIVGAIFFLGTILVIMMERDYRIGLYPFIAAKALIIGIGIIGATLLIFYALKGLNSKKI